jgi:hypothetical protein
MLLRASRQIFYWIFKAKLLFIWIHIVYTALCLTYKCLAQSLLASIKELDTILRKVTFTDFIISIATRPGFTRAQCWYYSVSLLYYVCYIHINLSLESLYLLKKPHQNQLRSFKNLSRYSDRRREATLFCTMLWYFENSILYNKVFDGPAVSELGVRSRKLSNVLKGQS